MNDRIIEEKRYLSDKDTYFLLDINSDNIFDNLEIDNIYLSDVNIKRINDLVIKEYYNDYNNPFVIEKDNIFKSNNLYINPDFYLKNLDRVNNLLCNYISKYEKQEFTINSAGLINNEIINAIINNSNIKVVNLTKYSKTPYVLTKDDYLKFKNSGKRVDTKVVSEELTEVFDDTIMLNSERTLIGYHKYRDLISKKGIFLDRELTEEELYNLKYINPDLMITLNIDNYEHLNVVSNRLKELGYKNNIKIKIDDKNSFNDFIFSDKLSDMNLYVETPDLESVKLEDYLKFEKILYGMLKNTNNLSPFEKYIYAYNITKQFKDYKENEQDKNASRKLYSVLVNEYMVCVGYSKLFGDLLTKMGISNFDLSVSVDTSYDNVSSKEFEFKESKLITKEGHARRYIHIIDPKYNIDGYYVADPTWDNDLEHDYYNHLAMTDNEQANTRRYMYLNDMDIFNVNNINEYIEKMNIMKRESKDYTKFLFGFNRLLGKVKLLDINTFNRLAGKYDFINKDTYYWPDNITGLVYDFGDLLINKVNKTIDGDTIFKAVENVYRNSYNYSEEDLFLKLEEVRKENIERQNKNFPSRYRINQEGTSEVLYDENKFEGRKL